METVIKEKWNEGLTKADNSYMKSRRVTIDPITRLEGHGKIDILLDEKAKLNMLITRSRKFAALRHFA